MAYLLSAQSDFCLTFQVSSCTQHRALWDRVKLKLNLVLWILFVMWRSFARSYRPLWVMAPDRWKCISYFSSAKVSATNCLLQAPWCPISGAIKYKRPPLHYNDVIMSAMVSQITILWIVYSTAYSGTDQRKHQSSASLAFVWGINRWPVNSPHKGPVTRKMFPFDDVIM